MESNTVVFVFSWLNWGHKILLTSPLQLPLTSLPQEMIRMLTRATSTHLSECNCHVFYTLSGRHTYAEHAIKSQTMGWNFLTSQIQILTMSCWLQSGLPRIFNDSPSNRVVSLMGLQTVVLLKVEL